MAIIRSPHKANFIIINKICLQDSKLSWKAKGIYAYIMSLPDNWKVKTAEIMRHSSDGRTALLSGLKELIKFGYCKPITNRTEKGTIQDRDYLMIEPDQLEQENLDQVDLNQENRSVLLSIDRSNIDSSKELDKTIVLSPEKKILNKKSTKKKGKKKKTPRKFNPKSPGGKIAQFMLDKIEENDPSFKTPEMGSWEACFNRMIFLEHYNGDEIKRVIKFALTDNFWKAIVINPYILRAKYHQLKTRMLNPIKSFKNKQTKEEKMDIFEEAKRDHIQ